MHGSQVVKKVFVIRGISIGLCRGWFCGTGGFVLPDGLSFCFVKKKQKDDLWAAPLRTRQGPWLGMVIGGSVDVRRASPTGVDSLWNHCLVI